MRSPFAVLSLALTLPLVGAGCFQVHPRVAQAPSGTEVAQTTETSSTPAAIAYLRLDGGSANVDRADQVYQAKDDMELNGGDAVTVTQGPVELVYPETGISRLETGTQIVLLPNDGADGSSIAAEIQLTAGSVWTRFEKLFGKDDHFNVVANGVVATVRGTAFGVSIDGDAADIQVADHEVQVMAENNVEPGQDQTPPALPVIALAAGQGLRATAQTFTRSDPDQLKALVHRLTATDQTKAGFLFAKQKILPERLKRPARFIKLPVAAKIPDRFIQRVRILESRAMLEKIFPQFTAPLRVPLDTELTPPTSTPTISGPAAGSQLLGQ